MNGNGDLSDRGNHRGEFTQGVGGWAEYRVHLTDTADTARHDVTPPPGKVIPVIFLPGVLGSNLRMSKERQHKLDRSDNQAWQPDDLVSNSGQIEVATGKGYGGWFKNATPAQRQLNLDPNETEVEYYHYTEDKGRFDPEGIETAEADARHQHVPDSFASIPPLLGERLTDRFAVPAGSRMYPRKRETPAQMARWRGWSEILFAGAYGDMLQYAERHLNNMLIKGQLHGMWKELLKDPRELGAAGGPALTEADIRHIAQCWYPVHAMGYNFLKSNGDAARTIAARIRGLVTGYQKRGFRCNEVIIVTHSMGGLVARALLHPSYGNLENDPVVKVLGMYHNVMPSTGAAATYRRMRFGFHEQPGAKAELKARVFGIDGENATAVLANAPGPLELLPGERYGSDWLKLVNGAGEVLWSWPRDGQDALSSIYLKPGHVWWRLINPAWVNPGRVADQYGGGLANVIKRLTEAAHFIRSIEGTFHSNSYSSYCDSTLRQCYGEVVLRIEEAELWKARTADFPPLETWRLLSEDGKGTLTVQAGGRRLTLKLQSARASGDETVPAERSGSRVPGVRFVHGKLDGASYEHQESYSAPQVLQAMLYSIVQIAKRAEWRNR